MRTEGIQRIDFSPFLTFFSRLHREGREFESLAAYQPSPCGLRLGKPAIAAVRPHSLTRRAKAVAPELEERRRTIARHEKSVERNPTPYSQFINLVA